MASLALAAGVAVVAVIAVLVFLGGDGEGPAQVAGTPEEPGAKRAFGILPAPGLAQTGGYTDPVGDGDAPPLGGPGAITYELSSDLTLSDSAPAYRLRKPQVTAALVEENGRRLGGSTLR